MDLSVIHDRRGHAELEISFHRPQNMTTIHQATLGLNVCNSKKKLYGQYTRRSSQPNLSEHKSQTNI